VVSKMAGKFTIYHYSERDHADGAIISSREVPARGSRCAIALPPALMGGHGPTVRQRNQRKEENRRMEIVQKQS
jgi:hypothetical protein